MSLEVAKSNGLDEIDEAHSEILEFLTGNATAAERDTWETKEQAAIAYVAGTADAIQTSMIETEAGLTGELPADLAANILANAAAFKSFIGLASGIRRKGRNAVIAATTEAEVHTILVNLSDEADAALAQVTA